MKYFKIFFLVPVFILSSKMFLVAQTKAKSTNYQLQKGRFLISANTISFSPAKTETRNFQNDVLQSTTKEKSSGLSFLFSSDYWGSGGFFNKTTDNFNSTNSPISSSKSSGGNIYLNPSAGYFVLDRLLIGVELLIQTGRSKFSSSSLGGNSSSENKERRFGIGPELRYYFGKPGNKQFPFIGISSLLSTSRLIYSQKNNINTLDISSKGNGASVTPYAGYSWLIGKRWLIEPAVMGNFNTNNANSKTTNINGNNSTVSNLESKFKSTSFAGIRLNVSFTL